jgi:hypothetical protein
MVDRALIRAKVNYGLGKAGVILGYPIAQYRPNGPTDPIASGNLLGTIVGDLDSHPALDFTQEAKFAQFQFYLLGDPTNLLPGDYLVGRGTDQSETDTFFVSACGGVEPAACIRCNQVVSVSRPDANATVPTAPVYGRQPAYSGAGPAQTQILASGFPASILQGTKGEKGIASLPDDTRLPWVAILMPPVPGVMFRTGDQLDDDISRRYILSSCELSALGWRMTGTLAET